jgi:hypothetical protein
VSRSPHSPYSEPSPLPYSDVLEGRKEQASAWFRSLRDRICGRFEAIEQ